MKKSKRIAALALSLVLMLGVLPLGLSPEAEAASPTDALADIAYYGDREKCALTYEMSQTYVDTLAEFEGKDKVEVCLADLADDGYPIMFVLDWQSDSKYDLYIFDRDASYYHFVINSANSSGLEYCEFDGWPALAIYDCFTESKPTLPTEWYTICTAGLDLGGRYNDHGDTGDVDDMWLSGEEFKEIDKTEILRYYKEYRHYIPGKLIADFSGSTDIFSLPTCKLSNAVNALSNYTEAVAPTPYDGVLNDIAYYGDRSKCRMTAEMAEAYAEVIESLPAWRSDEKVPAGKLRAALADPADDGMPILVTAYDCSDNYFDIRFWGYADGKAYDAEIRMYNDYGFFGKMDRKGLIFSTVCNKFGVETNYYYSVSGAEIKLEHTVEAYMVSPEGKGTRYPVGADYIISVSEDGDTVQLDVSKLAENGWQKKDFHWGSFADSWHLVLLDGKSISENCSCGNRFPGTLPPIFAHNFSAIAYDIAEEPIAYIDKFTDGWGRVSPINVCPTSNMLAVLRQYSNSDSVLPFTDVSESTWYHQWVKDAYQMGLINGKTATTYCPKDNMSYAEAVKLAACMHQRYTEGRVTLENGKGDWRSTYYDYCLETGIIPAAPEGEELGYRELFANAGRNIDRKTFVWLFSRALPAEAFTEINFIPDDSIPDVPADEGIWDEGIYLFYRAGILNGSDAKGTFNPESSIQRSEVAAILVRMMDAHYRVDAPAELGK